MSELIRIGLEEAAGRPGGRPSLDTHTRACLDATEDADSWSSAEVLYFRRAATPEELRAVLRQYPGCLVCAAPGSDGTDLLTWRQGTYPSIVRIDRANGDGPPPAVRASLLHALLVLSGTEHIARRRA